MDLRLFCSVLWRHRVILFVGVVVALCLATLDAARIGRNGLELRRPSTYLSYSRIFVTQHGFPWGRLGASSTSVATSTEDAGRLTSLATVYSQLVTSDAVHKLMATYHPPAGTLQAAPVIDPVDSQSALPIISIAAFSDSPAHAMDLARDATSALIEYVGTQQQSNAIPDSDRVELQVVMRADQAQLSRSASFAMPIVIFAAVLLATIGFVFVLENLRRPPVVDATKQSVRTAA